MYIRVNHQVCSTPSNSVILRYFRQWMNHFHPVWWSTFSFMFVKNDRVWVWLMERNFLLISCPYPSLWILPKLCLIFPLKYFSNLKYLCTEYLFSVLLHRCSLDSFLIVPQLYNTSHDKCTRFCSDLYHCVPIIIWNCIYVTTCPIF